MHRKMTNPRGGHSLRLAAAVLAGVLLVAFAAPSPAARASSDDTARQIEEAIQAQASNQAMLDAISAEADRLAGAVNQFTGDLAWLNSRSSEEVALYEKLVAEKEAALKEVDIAYSAYLAAEDTLSKKDAEYRERLQVMFEYREKSVLEIFLESGNLSGFFSNMELIRAVADYDERMLEELEAARDDAGIKRQDALRKQEDAAALVTVKQAEIDNLKGQIQRSSEELAAAQAQLAEKRALYEQEKAQSDEIAGNIQVLQKQYGDEKAREEAIRVAEERRKREEEARKNLISYNGQMQWPVPSSNWITSLFQPEGRTDLPGQTRPHLGVDIGGGYGTPVVAAAEGFIIVAYNPWEGQNTGGYGYGNYIVVDHGNGIATLYGHLKNVHVAIDQYVFPGDVIGLMGSTGNSTGPHLHFEVRINGYPVDPLQPSYIGNP